jgi:hypothetical protein
MRTRTKNRRSSENPTNSAAHSRLRQVEFAYVFRAAGLAWLLRRFREVPDMRAWIGSGKEDWRRPLPRPGARTLPDAIILRRGLL